MKESLINGIINRVKDKSKEKSNTTFNTPLRDKKESNIIQSSECKMKKNNSKQSLASLAKENHNLSSLKKSIYLNTSKT